EGAEAARAGELREIARICAKVPAQPAETFQEAVQMLWFAYMVAGDGVGRPDVYLNDYYVADLQAGRITPEQAQELVECLMVKLHGDYAEGVYNVSSIHTLTLAGVLPDGSDATNDLTRLFLRAIQSVRLLRPTIYVRCHDETPQDVLELAVEMLGEGLAEPSFYGDKPVIAGLERLGVPLEQAREYALSGCTEIVVPGANWGAPNGWINLALLVDDAIREFAEGEIQSDARLWQIITRRAEELAEVCRVNNEHVDDVRVDGLYAAGLLMPVCLEKCQDIVHGGAASYMGHWEAMGLPNAADMLLAVARLVFEEGERLPELLERLDNDDPALRKRLSHLPRFGNGEEAVDEIAARLVRIMSEALERRSTRLRSHLVLGHLAGGENMHIAYGLVMGPTLDGRRAGETLSDSLAGSQGQTRGGPTAVVADESGVYIGAACTENIENYVVKISPDGSRRLWSKMQRVPWKGAVALARSGDRLLVLSANNEIWPYAAADGTDLPAIATSLPQTDKEKPEDPGRHVGGLAANDREMVLCYPDRGLVRWCDPISGKQLGQVGGLDKPTAVAIATDGTTYALCGTTILRLDRKAPAHATVVAGLSKPDRIALNNAGEILVHDAATEQVLRFA
ncbi:MAG: pyruvate formate lyase family protein, partial [Armatimonadota bacterium]